MAGVVLHFLHIALSIGSSIFRYSTHYKMTTISPSSPLASYPPSVPCHTSKQMIEEMKAACTSKDARRFRELLSAIPQDDIRDLDPVIMAAVRYQCPEIVSDLVRRGFPVHSDHVLEAIKYKSKDILSVFWRNGWGINEPVSELKPSVLE